MSSYPVFPSLACAFSIVSQKIPFNSKSHRSLPSFSSKSFIVLALNLRIFIFKKIVLKNHFIQHGACSKPNVSASCFGFYVVLVDHHHDDFCHNY